MASLNEMLEETNEDVMTSDTQILGEYFRFITPKTEFFQGRAEDLEKSVSEIKEYISNGMRSLQDKIDQSNKEFEPQVRQITDIGKKWISAVEDLEGRVNKEELDELKTLGNTLVKTSNALADSILLHQNGLYKTIGEISGEVDERLQTIMQAAIELKDETRFTNETLSEHFNSLFEEQHDDMEK